MTKEPRIKISRWFNYRPICLVFTFLLLGSVFAFYITNHLPLTLGIFIGSFVLLLMIAIFNRKPKYFLVPFLAFILGISLYYLAVFRYTRQVDSAPSVISARIYEVKRENDGSVRCLLDNVKFDNTKTNTNLNAYVYDSSNLFDGITVGQYITFSPYKFYNGDLFYGDVPSAYNYSENLKYTVLVKIDNISFGESKMTLSERFKAKIKENLYMSLTNENAELAYSSLFSDKIGLNSMQYSNYQLAGVAHLLAVSGLHIGIIVAILYFILDRLHTNKWAKLGILIGFLLIYDYLCGFAFSVVRASIMAVILLLAKNIKAQYDSLTSICFAGTIIFLINPLCVFDVGFLMSFGCVTGIAILYGPFCQALTKTKAPKAVVESMAISLATTITLIVIMAYYFERLSIVSIVANLILIPLFTVAFVPVFVISLVSVIIPYIVYIIYPINYIFDLMNVISSFFAGLFLSNINTITFNYIAIIAYFALILFLGRFCTTKTKYKLAITLPMLAILVVCLL